MVHCTSVSAESVHPNFLVKSKPCQIYVLLTNYIVNTLANSGFFKNFLYQGGVKSTVSWVFEDLKLKISEGSDPNWSFPDSAQLAVSVFLVRTFWNFKLKVLKYSRNCSLHATLIPNLLKPLIYIPRWRHTNGQNDFWSCRVKQIHIWIYACASFNALHQYILAVEFFLDFIFGFSIKKTFTTLSVHWCMYCLADVQHLQKIEISVGDVTDLIGLFAYLRPRV